MNQDPHDHDHSSDGVARLAEADAAAVDALIEADFDLERVPAAMQVRAAAALRLFRRLEAIEDASASEADLRSLTHATMLRIDRHESERQGRLAVRQHLETRTMVRSRFRIGEFAAIAAVLILTVSLAVPLTNHVRTNRGIAACGDGMRSLGGAFAAYADDHEGSMPFAASLVPGLDFGSGRFPIGGGYHHGDQLRALSDGGYCSNPHCLGCPNHPTQGGTFSFRVPAHEAELRMALVPALVIVGDRNPVLELVLGGERVQLERCSPEHDDRGQNVMHGDGAVIFLRDPRLARPGAEADNIWLPFAGREDLLDHDDLVGTAQGEIFLLN